MFKEKRFDKLYRLMDERKFDCTVVGPSGDMRYMIGFDPGGCERFQALFLLKDARSFYIVNKLYLEDMKNVLPSDTEFYIWGDGDDFLGCVKQAFTDFGLEKKRLAVSDSIRAVDLIDMQEALQISFFNGNDMLEEFRIIKSDENIENMREAARIADQVMLELTRFIRPGITEGDIADKILASFCEKNVEPSFTPIVASGSNNSRPHYNGSSRIITEKDVIILDFGCKVNGYCSDTSRTFFVGGITAEEERIYNIVKRAYQAAADHAGAGVTAGSVDRRARDIIEKEGYGDFFINRTGHGIGFDVHEAPYIKPESNLILERGMAFSIEPGVYIPGRVGMRIEDILVIDRDGNGVALNRFSKDITVL